MLSNNNQRLNIWLSIQNKFDYKEFAITCIQQSIDPLSISEFSQKAGMISVAMVEYPDKKPDEEERGQKEERGHPSSSSKGR